MVPTINDVQMVAMIVALVSLVRTQWPQINGKAYVFGLASVFGIGLAALLDQGAGWREIVTHGLVDALTAAGGMQAIAYGASKITGGLLFVLALGASQTACLGLGSFEEARLAGVKDRVSAHAKAAGMNEADARQWSAMAAATATPSEYCAGLDGKQMVLHALAVGAGVLSAGSGIPALALSSDRDDVKRGLAVGTIIAATASAVLVLWADNVSTAWVRDCSQEGAK
jgi:hypothetical protein